MEIRFTKKIGIGVLCVSLMLLLSAGIPFNATAADQVRIGLLEPLAGPFEANGRHHIEGVKFAVDEQNAKGGLFGKKIEVFVEDSEMKPDVGVRKAKKLILQDKCNFIGIGSSSSVSVGLNRVAEDHKVIHINYGAMAAALLGKEFTRYAFRTCSTIHNVTVGMILLAKSKGYKKFYTLSTDNLPGHETYEIFENLLKIHFPDAQIVGKDFHPLGTKDFSPYITKIKAANPDAVLTGSMGTDMINGVKHARLLGLKTPFMSHMFVDPYLMNELKEDGAGLIYSHNCSTRVKTPEFEDYVRRFHEKHKNDKDFYLWWPIPECTKTVFGIKMLLAALEKAGSADPETFIKTFEGFEWKSPYRTVWRMRPCDHNVVLPMYGGMTEGGWNPFYNGSIRPEVKFPWEGEKIQEFPTEQVAMPANISGQPSYNPRCK